MTAFPNGKKWGSKAPRQPLRVSYLVGTRCHGKKISLFPLKVKLALTDSRAMARTFPINPANPCNIPYANLAHPSPAAALSQQELTAVSQFKPVKVYGNTQLTVLPKKEF